MKKICISLIVPLLAVCSTGSTVFAAGADGTAKLVKKVPAHSSQSISGPELYREYCAVCHGTGGRGDGPAASALKTRPANLTQIARANSGIFPKMNVQYLINGEADVPSAHGSKDMPVWGNIFRNIGGNPSLGTVRVYNLMKYIEQMQVQ